MSGGGSVTWEPESGAQFHRAGGSGELDLRRLSRRQLVLLAAVLGFMLGCSIILTFQYRGLLPFGLCA